MKRGFEHLNCDHVTYLERWDLLMLLFALYLMFLFCGKCDTHSCSASAIINSWMVSIVDSLLSTLHASANCILRCEANAYISFCHGCHPLFWHLAASPLDAYMCVHSPHKIWRNIGTFNLQELFWMLQCNHINNRLLLVLSCAPRGFSLGTPVFLPAIDCTISCSNPAGSQGHMSAFLIC